MLNCTASTGSIEPSCFADVTVVVRKNEDGLFPNDIKIMIVTAPTAAVADQDAKEAWKTISEDVRTFKELKAAYNATRGDRKPTGKASTKDSKKLNMKAMVNLSSSGHLENVDEIEDEGCEDCKCQKHKIFFMIIAIGMILAVGEYYFGICS